MTMEDKETFLSYLEEHGKTERALVSGVHLNRLLNMAGHPEGYVSKVDDSGWYRLDTEASAPLIALARERAPAIVIPFPRKLA